MKVTPDDYGRRCQFDHFCKLVLYHEAVDYFRERKRQRGWETSFETLPLSDHGDRDGGSKCVTTGSICVPNKKSESSRKELSGFFVFTRM